MRSFQLLLVSLVLAITGCSTNEEPKAPMEISEFASAEGTSALDTPEGELFEQARSLYESGLYSIAKEQFATLKTGYPLSPFAEFSELKMADCDFEGGYYEAAAQAYEEFLKNHPASSSAPYVAYRVARSYQLNSKGVGRDAAPLEKALELYDVFISRYPESVYVDSAKNFREEVLIDLAASEKRIADFYKKTGYEKAASEREKKHELIASKFKVTGEKTSTGPKPLVVRVQRRSVQIGSIENTKEASPSKFEIPTMRETTYVVRDIQCQGAKFFLLLNKEFQDGKFIEAISKAQPGKFSITLPDTTGQSKEIACGPLGTVTFNESGSLSFDVPSKLIGMSIDNPPRILVSPAL